MKLDLQSTQMSIQGVDIRVRNIMEPWGHCCTVSEQNVAVDSTKRMAFSMFTCANCLMMSCAIDHFQSGATALHLRQTCSNTKRMTFSMFTCANCLMMSCAIGTNTVVFACRKQLS